MKGLKSHHQTMPQRDSGEAHPLRAGFAVVFERKMSLIVIGVSHEKPANAAS